MAGAPQIDEINRRPKSFFPQRLTPQDCRRCVARLNSCPFKTVREFFRERNTGRLGEAPFAVLV
jgi:hypothetical protein